MTMTVNIIEAGMSGAPITKTLPQPGRIPFGAIDRYARRYGIEGEAFDRLVTLIDPMDREYLAWEAEQTRERLQRMRA